jgi:hypothetical protein
MAHALRVDPAGLLRLAARVVLQTLYVYDKSAAMRDCGNALRMSDTQVEWLTRCQQIWQKYYLDQTGATVDIKMELSFSEIVEFVYQYLGRKQQLKLARRLIRQHPLDEAKKYLETPERLLEEVEKQLEGEMSDGERFLRSYDEASAAINAFMDRIENLRNDPQVWLNRIEDAVKLIPEKRKRSAYNSFALLRRPKRRKSWLPTLVDHPAFTTTRQ